MKKKHFWIFKHCSLKSSKYIFFILAIFLLSSCISNKKITYLQTREKNSALSADSLISYSVPVYRLQYNDIVDVRIKTTVPEMNALFGLDDPATKQSSSIGANQANGDIYYMTGYTIDQQGEIKLPFIGKVKLMGLTIEEAENVIIRKLAGYFKKLSEEDLYVKVKLGGIRFSTLGEFNKPGKYVVLQERMTIFDAIAQSGDLTVQAKRKKIVLLRQYPEGTKIHYLNLNDRSIINSPYYFIQPNDQIYAESLKVREFGTGVTGAQTLQVIISSLSAIVLVLSLTK